MSGEYAVQLGKRQIKFALRSNLLMCSRLLALGTLVVLYYCWPAPLAIELRPPVNWPAEWGRSADVVLKLHFNLAPDGRRAP